MTLLQTSRGDVTSTFESLLILGFRLKLMYSVLTIKFASSVISINSPSNTFLFGSDAIIIFSKKAYDMSHVNFVIMMILVEIAFFSISCLQRTEKRDVKRTCVVGSETKTILFLRQNVFHRRNEWNGCPKQYRIFLRGIHTLSEMF